MKKRITDKKILLATLLCVLATPNSSNAAIEPIIGADSLFSYSIGSDSDYNFRVMDAAGDYTYYNVGIDVDKMVKDVNPYVNPTWAVTGATSTAPFS